MADRPAEAPVRRTRYQRFTVSDRTEHWVQVVAFVALAVTGLVQRYDGAWLSLNLIDVMGGIEAVRIIHRVFAIVLMVAVVYHFGAAGYRRYVLRQPKSMVFTWNDLRAIGESIGHALRLRRDPPKQGRYTWEEKVEYWALLWGTMVMIITGFMLWNPIATTNVLPGQFIPAAKEAHSGEALLAVLAILAWHVYHVHLRHFNTSIFTGTMSREEMEEFHPLELDAIESGEPLQETDPAEIRRRSRLYLPAYTVVGAVLLAGIYLFVTFENTAITTIEPIEDVDVFVPTETTTTTVPGTTTTTVPEAEPTWAGTFEALLTERCGSCHGAAAAGGLDVTSYDALLAGGDDGPGIVPGDRAGGTVVEVMLAGGHPATLTADELALLQDWIAAGAPETEADIGTGATTTTTVVEATWVDVIAPIVDLKCLTCHGTEQAIGGLDLSSYESALAGGDSGPGIVPGDPAAGSVYRVMLQGGHPLQFSPQELEILRLWILAGAPER